MTVFDYSGQWIGQSSGEPAGQIVMDLDSSPQGSRGFIYLFSTSPADFPSSFVEVNLNTAKKKFSVEATPQAFDSRNGSHFTRKEVETHFPNVPFPNRIKIDLIRSSKDELELSWLTSIGTYGVGGMKRSRMPALSMIPAEAAITSWIDYKDEMSRIEFRKFIFRGQSRAYPLQTSFHRSKRKVLPRYLVEDVQILHRSITGRTRYVFNLDRAVELGALMNLAQHHGFPTPLLDWTYSPFVAAWFAYQNALVGRNKGEFVRIFQICRQELLGFVQIENLTFTFPHTSILEALAIDNDRAIPQQGLLMFTNMQDIEAHIKLLEATSGRRMLVAYDLPIEDAKDAINDLAMMGITRSTMLPGIESICLDLKDRLFS